MSGKTGRPETSQEAGQEIAGKTLIRAGGLSFRYPGAPASLWGGLDFELRKGDRLLLAGPSGSGKSTLLGIMSGLVPRLTSGSVSGTIERSFASYGLVMQNPYAQLVAPTVFEELAFCLENSAVPVPEIRDRVKTMLVRVGISGLKERSCASLSGGEAQKLSLACALINDPEILFLDEPTAYLDPWSAEDFFLFLESFASGRTLVVVEHRVGEAASLVDSVFLLDGQGGGGIQADVAGSLKRLRFVVPDARLKHQGFPDSPGGQNSPAGGGAAPSLEVSNLSHRFGDRVVLDSLNLSLRPGRISVVMGPSGSGKSTLLKRIAGWLPPSSAKPHDAGAQNPSILFARRDWLREKPKRRAGDIVFIPQNPEHFFLTMSLRDELAYTGAGADTVKVVAGRFRLPADSIQHPASLSEGEKRRLTLACAFLDPRPLVLMDEPSYGLDLESTITLIDGLYALRDQNRSILIVTHSPELAQTVADDLFVMRDGALFSFDPSDLPSLIASFPKHPHKALA